MQKPFRETQTLLHPGNPFSKPAPLRGGTGYSVTWTVSSLQIYVLFRLGDANVGFVFLLSVLGFSVCFRSQILRASLRHYVTCFADELNSVFI